jgi:hypothetical protein
LLFKQKPFLRLFVFLRDQGKRGIPLFTDTLEIFPFGSVCAFDIKYADIAFVSADTQVVDTVTVEVGDLLDLVFVFANTDKAVK